MTTRQVSEATAVRIAESAERIAAVLERDELRAAVRSLAQLLPKLEAEAAQHGVRGDPHSLEVVQ